MQVRILYQLTMRCDKESCQLAFTLHRIEKVDKGYIYLENNKIPEEYLGKIICRSLTDKTLLTVYFVQKEAVLMMVRQMGIYIYKNCKHLFPSVREEWSRLRFQKYDSAWFVQNSKVTLWEREFRQEFDELAGH